MKRTLLFTVIASVLTTGAFATSATVTSKDYVDNADAQKVDIAQGVGTNNANVGKTLVVNSSGNLELGTVSAGNYIEDSITDGVTNKAPSENAVHDALANKQNTIPATGTNSSTPGSTVVTYTGTAGQIGERGIFNFETDWDFNNNAIVSGHEGDLLDAGSIVPGLYRIDQALQGTAGNVITYDENGYAGGERGIYDGSTTYNSSTDANKLVTASVVQNASNNMPETTVTYKTCTQWVEGQSHTDANCLLWSLNDIPIRAKQCYTDADCANAQGLGCSSPTCDAGVCFCDSR